MVCVPAPPWQSDPESSFGAAGGAGVTGWAAPGWRAGGLAGEGGAVAEGRVDGLGEETAMPMTPAGGVAVANTVGSERAVGGSGAVQPTTKRTARNTAVAVRAVQQSQTRK